MRTHVQVDVLSFDIGEDGKGFHFLGWFREHIFQSAFLGVAKYPASPGRNVRWRIDFLFMVKIIWRETW